MESPSLQRVAPVGRKRSATAIGISGSTFHISFDSSSGLLRRGQLLHPVQHQTGGEGVLEQFAERAVEVDLPFLLRDVGHAVGHESREVARHGQAVRLVILLGLGEAGRRGRVGGMQGDHDEGPARLQDARLPPPNIGRSSGIDITPMMQTAASNGWPSSETIARSSVASRTS